MIVSSALAAAALCLLLGVWLRAGAPFSVEEWRFHQRLAEVAPLRPRALELSLLMPGDWELVCEAHCYDGPEIYVPRYRRKYPAVACGDGDWGLLFISADGSYEAVSRPWSSACIPALSLGRHSCLSRSEATLLRRDDREGCPVYRADSPPERPPGGAPRSDGAPPGAAPQVPAPAPP
jgi:hypothetical protein